MQASSPRRLRLSHALLSLVLTTACASSLSPRETVIRVLEVGIGTANPDVIRPLIGPTYTQHNPRVPDGPQGLLGFVEKFRARPASARPKVKVIRTIVDGDFVIAHTQYRRRGLVAAFDMFRVADGKLVEHWDAGQTQPATTVSGHTMMDGPTEIVDRERTEQNKAVVLFFAHEVLIKRNLALIPVYFDGEAYVEHEPTRADGVAALRASLGAEAASAPSVLVHEEARRVFGEGNFVVLQSRGRLGAEPVVIYDLYRVAKGRIAEHWSVFEKIPVKAANDNGML